jgi:hypothetical protein
MPTHDTDNWEYHAYLATGIDLKTSVNWASHSQPTDNSCFTAAPTTFTTSHPDAERIHECQFAFDTATTCHISLERSDFKTLHPIPHHPVTRLGDACIYTVGIGTIELRITAGHTLVLQDVLFIPTSSIHLLLVLTLNRSGQFTSHFDSTSCWVTNKSGVTIVCGYISEIKNLYFLSSPSMHVMHKRPKLTTFYSTSATPDVETWHRHLSHCSTCTVIDMARNCAVAGMTIDLSNSPPKCNHCILGKQTWNPIPKSWVNGKATCPLQKVFVDLCGPMHVTSRSGRLYSMNVIDDFSSYVWSLPLRSKSDAVPVLHAWAKAVEAISSHKLVTLVTDNGELVSKSMMEWCSLHSITHLLTAPHTSAQNGHTECLHRTILDKARTMRIACNVPSNLWDGFCAASAYLTNLTASSSINRKTPSELWHGQVPDMSHLREIGSQAFALNLTPNPKIAQHSSPCILIGYTPNSKAYRLWDPASSCIFNSYHISFIEHLDTLPTPLLPNMIISLDNSTSGSAQTDSMPNSNSVSGPPIGSAPQQQSVSIPPIGSAHQHQSASGPPIGSVPSMGENLETPLHPLRCSPWHPVPTSHENTDDMFHHSRRLSATIDDAHATSAWRQEEKSHQNIDPHTMAFLTKYSPLCDSHDLIPMELPMDAEPTIDEVLAAIADGTMEPKIDPDDKPKWADAIASPEREYWIASG